MGKWIVIGIFTLACCWGALRCFPGLHQHLFYVGSFSVSGTMLLGVGFLWMGSKLSGKK